MHTGPHNKNGHRRRQLRARILATATHCSLCGQPLNPDTKWPHPQSTVIDEDLPRARGGDPLSRENTTAMHAACNRFKSTMTLQEARTALKNGTKPARRINTPHIGEWNNKTNW